MHLSSNSIIEAAKNNYTHNTSNSSEESSDNSTDSDSDSSTDEESYDDDSSSSSVLSDSSSVGDPDNDTASISNEDNNVSDIIKYKNSKQLKRQISLSDEFNIELNGMRIPNIEKQNSFHVNNYWQHASAAYIDESPTLPTSPIFNYSDILNRQHSAKAHFKIIKKTKDIIKMNDLNENKIPGYISSTSVLRKIYKNDNHDQAILNDFVGNETYKLYSKHFPWNVLSKKNYRNDNGAYPNLPGYIPAYMENAVISLMRNQYTLNKKEHDKFMASSRKNASFVDFSNLTVDFYSKIYWELSSTDLCGYNECKMRCEEKQCLGYLIQSLKKTSLDVEQALIISQFEKLANLSNVTKVPFLALYFLKQNYEQIYEWDSCLKYRWNAFFEMMNIHHHYSLFTLETVYQISKKLAKSMEIELNASILQDLNEDSNNIPYHYVLMKKKVCLISKKTIISLFPNHLQKTDQIHENLHISVNTLFYMICESFIEFIIRMDYSHFNQARMQLFFIQNNISANMKNIYIGYKLDAITERQILDYIKCNIKQRSSSSSQFKFENNQIFFDFFNICFSVAFTPALHYLNVESSADEINKKLCLSIEQFCRKLNIYEAGDDLQLFNCNSNTNFNINNDEYKFSCNKYNSDEEDSDDESDIDELKKNNHELNYIYTLKESNTKTCVLKKLPKSKENNVYKSEILNDLHLKLIRTKCATKNNKRNKEDNDSDNDDDGGGNNSQIETNKSKKRKKSSTSNVQLSNIAAKRGRKKINQYDSVLNTFDCYELKTKHKCALCDKSSNVCGVSLFPNITLPTCMRCAIYLQNLKSKKSCYSLHLSQLKQNTNALLRQKASYMTGTKNKQKSVSVFHIAPILYKDDTFTLLKKEDLAQRTKYRKKSYLLTNSDYKCKLK